jgi:inosine-uridine nucleoside N-ribohydrolase
VRNIFPILLCISILSATGVTAAPTEQRIPIIIDTDFVMPPSDDSMALMLAIQSPELEILGVTTVAGNDSVERATSDVLRMLEIANQAAIPVFQGADMPLVHEKSDFAVEEYGNWYSDLPPPIPPGGFASNKAEDESAVSFIVRTVLANPHQVTLVAIGPLTNIARAIRSHPEF